MPIPLAVPIIAGAASFISGLFGDSAAREAERKAAAEKAKAQRALDALIDDRQDVINPFENVDDLSSMLSNPMANLSVATQAAEMQVEESDISLANTLDTVRATGGSKKGVSASIEAQEAQNEKLKAQGQQRLQQQEMAEAQRMQSAESQGKQFVFNAQEQRDTAQMDRLSSQISGAAQRESQASADQTGALTGAIGGIASVAGSYMGAMGGTSSGTSPSSAFQSANPRNRASGSGAIATGIADVI